MFIIILKHWAKFTCDRISISIKSFHQIEISTPSLWPQRNARYIQETLQEQVNSMLVSFQVWLRMIIENADKLAQNKN